MAEARQSDQWDHTAQLLACIANGLLRGKGEKAWQPGDFHPYHRAKQRDKPACRVGIEIFGGIANGR